MTIHEAKRFIEEARKRGSVLGMESIRRLCENLHNPQDYGRIIHIAGTNGKGSTGRMMEQALMAMGYTVGRYSSPAVFAYEEIIQVNQTNITWEELAELFEEIKQAADAQTTSFEMETAAAFLYFKKRKCDFSIIEVGMGGSEDATNVIASPIASVITSISMDHTAFLGNTLVEIAEKKAGIIKPSGVVIKLWQEPEVNEVIACQTKRIQGSLKHLYWARKQDYPVLSMTTKTTKVAILGKEEVAVGLTGAFQQENIACAFTTLKALEQQGILPLSQKKEAVFAAFKNVTWPGRMEVILEKPLCIVDGCHNPDAAVKMRQTLETVYAGCKIHFVIGVFKDKDYEGIFSKVLPLGVSAECISPKGERGLNQEELGRVAKRYLQEVRSYERVEDAVKNAISLCKENEDMVLCFGSLSYLGEVKKYVNGICESADSE